MESGSLRVKDEDIDGPVTVDLLDGDEDVDTDVNVDLLDENVEVGKVEVVQVYSFGGVLGGGAENGRALKEFICFNFALSADEVLKEGFARVVRGGLFRCGGDHDRHSIFASVLQGEDWCN